MIISTCLFKYLSFKPYKVEQVNTRHIKDEKQDLMKIQNTNSKASSQENTSAK